MSNFELAWHLGLYVGGGIAVIGLIACALTSLTAHKEKDE